MKSAQEGTFTLANTSLQFLTTNAFSAFPTKKWFYFFRRISRVQASLMLIILIQASITLITMHNSAFQDEALYLFAGRQIVHNWLGGPAMQDHYGLYFSGYPQFYPVIGGLLDMLGGVEAARFFSTLCMLLVTLCVYYVTRRLTSTSAGLFAAALFAFQGPVLFLTRLATYDALCLAFLALATCLVLYVSKHRTPWCALAIGPLLFLAVLAKYAALLFLPGILALLVIRSLQRLGWKRMLLRAGLALLSLALCACIAWLLMDKDVLTGLSFTTTNRATFIRTPLLTLLTSIVTLIGCLFVLAFLGLLFMGRQTWLTGLLLYGMGLLAPVYHLYKGEFVSLNKHMAFAAFFLMPLAGYATARIAGYRPGTGSSRYWITALSCCVLIFSLGLPQAQTMYQSWGSSVDLSRALHTQLHYGSGYYLSEDFDVVRYSTQDVTASWQWVSLDYFEYTDRQGHHLLGKSAYSAALHEGYFDIVELNYVYKAELSYALSNQIQVDKNYEQIAKVPYEDSYGKGSYVIWRRK